MAEGILGGGRLMGGSRVKNRKDYGGPTMPMANMGDCRKNERAKREERK